MSIRPRFADLLFAGLKTVELRRRPLALRSGDKVYVYASSPIMAVRGSFVVSAVVRMPLRDLWAQFGTRAQVTRLEFDKYFAGLKEGIAIEIGAVAAEPEISLAALRIAWPGFHPPQTLRYLTEAPTVARASATRPASSGKRAGAVKGRGPRVA